MTIHLTIHPRAIVLAFLLFALSAAIVPAALSLAKGDDREAESRVAAGTGFTYQGRIEQDGLPVSGTRTLRFTLRSDAVANATVGSPLTQSLTVTEGIFSTVLDFGSNAFDGQARWIDVEVETSPGIFALLPPRQPLSAAPYALFSLKTAPHNHVGETWIANGGVGLALLQGADGGRALDLSTSGYNSTGLLATNSGDCNLVGRLCYAVWGKADANGGGNGYGGVGVRGDGSNAGVLGTSPQYGVAGTSTYGTGMVGTSASGNGVFGTSSTATGVIGKSASSFGVRGESTTNVGVSGFSTSSVGVRGRGATLGVEGLVNDDGATGVRGENTVGDQGIGVSGEGFYGVFGSAVGAGYGIFGLASDAGWAGYFEGFARVTKALYVDDVLPSNTACGGGGCYVGDTVKPWTAVYSYAYPNMSDERLKKDVSGLPYGLAEVLALRPVSFEWKSDGPAGRKLGLIAQEVEHVIPEVVAAPEAEDGYYAVEYSGLVAVLIQAIQEQQSTIEDQGARIVALEGLIH